MLDRLKKALGGKDPCAGLAQIEDFPSLLPMLLDLVQARSPLVTNLSNIVHRYKFPKLAHEYLCSPPALQRVFQHSIFLLPIITPIIRDTTDSTVLGYLCNILLSIHKQYRQQFVSGCQSLQFTQAICSRLGLPPAANLIYSVLTQKKIVSGVKAGLVEQALSWACKADSMVKTNLTTAFYQLRNFAQQNKQDFAWADGPILSFIDSRLDEQSLKFEDAQLIAQLVLFLRVNVQPVPAGRAEAIQQKVIRHLEHLTSGPAAANVLVTSLGLTYLLPQQNRINIFEASMRAAQSAKLWRNHMVSKSLEQQLHALSACSLSISNNDFSLVQMYDSLRLKFLQSTGAAQSRTKTDSTKLKYFNEEVTSELQSQKEEKAIRPD